MCVSCECCVLSDKGIYNGPSLLQRSVSMCDLETSKIRRPWPPLGCCAREKKKFKPQDRNLTMQLLKRVATISINARSLLCFQNVHYREHRHTQIGGFNYLF